MPIDRVDTLLEALEESQLLTAAQLAECRGGLSGFADTRALARHLLQRDWLTPFQVNHLLQGKADELFLDNYVLLERIGQGGMGQVFRARHRIMDRVVALKIIRPERLANPDLVKRFRREIKLAGQLAHPNIVAAYDADEIRGTHFLVMEFVEGIDLARHVEKNGRRPVAQAAEWVRQVALGLQHAHERGMVHRDIKPANLLLAVKENVVKVLDMGLARLSQGADAEQTAAGLTQEGTVMGTPDYMAPEQAEESTAVDIRADIYSLGCTLYFLLAGQAPFAGGTLAQKLRKHAHAEPEPLSARRDDVPAGLVAVVRRMMAKRLDDRYQTPGEVAAALVPFCHAGPVVAVPVSAAAPVAIPVGPPARPVAVPLSPESHADQATPIPGTAAPAQAEETIPPSVLDSVASVTLQQGQGPLARARRAWRRLGRRGQVIAGAAAGVVLLALLIVLFSHKTPPPITDRPEAPKAVLDRLSGEDIPPEDRAALPKELKPIVVAVLGEHRVRVPNFVCMALSPDRKTVAVADGADIRLVDTKTLRVVRELKKHTQAVLCLAFSADGKFLASGGNDGRARVWNVEKGEEVGNPFEPGSAVQAVALTPNGKELLLAANGNSQVAVYDVAKADKGERRTYTGHKTPVRALVVSADGKLAYSAGGTTEVGKEADKDVHVWEVATGNPVSKLTGHEGFVSRLELSPDGKRLLAATDKPYVPVWKLAEGSGGLRPLRIANPPSPSTPSDGTFVGEKGAASCANGKVRPFVTDGRADGYQELNAIPLEATYPNVAWLNAVPRDAKDGAGSDSGLLFVAGGTLRVWDIDQSKEWRPPLGHTQPARGLTFLGDGERVVWLVSSGDDRTVRVWDLADLYDPATKWPRESRRALSATGPGNNLLIGAPVSADGNLALTLFNTEPFVTVWRFQNDNWEQLSRLEPKDTPQGTSLTALSISAEGTRALTCGTDKVLRLWDLKRQEAIRKVEVPNACSMVRLLSNGGAYTWDGAELRLWDRLDGDNPSFKVVRAQGTALTVAPGLETAILGEADGHLTHLTDLGAGKPPPPPLQWWQKGTISALALAPDRQTFVAGSYGDVRNQGPRVGLWDMTKVSIDRAPPMWELRGPPTALTFAPDGRHAAMANPDGTIYILRLPR
jgi:serine/threonine-protein kinase